MYLYNYNYNYICYSYMYIRYYTNSIIAIWKEDNLFLQV